MGHFVQSLAGSWAGLYGWRVTGWWQGLHHHHWAQEAWVAAHTNPLSVCCAAQICPSRLAASQLWLGSESSARRDKYSICWEAVFLPWSPAEWAMRRPACLLSVCVFSSEPRHSLSLSLSTHLIGLHFCLSACLSPPLSVCLSINLPIYFQFLPQGTVCLMST